MTEGIALGLICLAVSVLVLIIETAKLHRDVDEVLTFVRAFLDSIHLIKDHDDWEGGAQDD